MSCPSCFILGLFQLLKHKPWNSLISAPGAVRVLPEESELACRLGRMCMGRARREGSRVSTGLITVLARRPRACGCGVS